MKDKKSQPIYKIKNSKIHGKGVYANKTIPKNTKVIEYLGEIVSKKEGDKRAKKQFFKSKRTGSGAVYVFELNSRKDIDGDVSWNHAKYINHSCDPNCKFKIAKDQIWISSLKRIKKGEELSYDYGYDLDDYQDHLCKCGSKKCISFIIGKKYRKEFEMKKK